MLYLYKPLFMAYVGYFMSELNYYLLFIIVDTKDGKLWICPAWSSGFLQKCAAAIYFIKDNGAGF